MGVLKLALLLYRKLKWEERTILQHYKSFKFQDGNNGFSDRFGSQAVNPVSAISLT